MRKGKWIWDTSMVTFIRKMDKDSYLVPGSFRPITISSYIGKIFERVLHQRLLLYCQRNQVIDNAQEGFLPQRSTTRYLYKMSASIAEARKKRLNVILLFCDFEKAFDSISTSAMIFKLNMLGISGDFLQLVHSFLTDRNVTLKVNDYIGHQRLVGLFGLPQGSVLSPLLFVIFVTDLFKDIHLLSGSNESALVFKYADDGSVMVAAKSLSDCFNLMQKICDQMSEWCRKWRLAVNCKRNKTEAVIVKSKDVSSTVLGKLVISGQTIEFVSKSRVLGISVDEDMSFQDHARNVLKSCWYEWYRLSSHTTRKRGLNTSTLSLLFKTAVLTKLMYGAPVWLQANVDVFKGFISKVLLKISGSQFYSSNAVLEVALLIPPLQQNLDFMTMKFVMKGLSLDDELKAVILQIEESPNHPYYRHTILIKEFLAWKRTGKFSTCRSLQLLDITDEEMQYGKLEMHQYMCAKWDQNIICNTLEHFIGSWNFTEQDENNDSSNELISTHRAFQNSLFLRVDKRCNSSNIMDFLHGHCLRFRNFRHTVEKDHGITDECLDCNHEKDSIAHKLFHCPTFAGSKRDALTAYITDDDIPLLKVKLLFATHSELIVAFKQLVYHICDTSEYGDDYCGAA